MRNGWWRYGKWMHPKEWWEGKLNRWLKELPMEYPKAKVIEVRKTDIVFGMAKHYGRLIVSKEKVLREIGEIEKLYKDEY